MILCWASRTAILGLMQPAGRRPDPLQKVPEQVCELTPVGLGAFLSQSSGQSLRTSLALLGKVVAEK